MKSGNLGLFAYVDDVPVAYGWCKHQGSKDYFFNIGKDSCYLCRFFTSENVRGHNIYPSLISELIAREENINDFYIDIEDGNVSSEKGLMKVGFKRFKSFKFYRLLKITLNKQKL